METDRTHRSIFGATENGRYNPDGSAEGGCGKESGKKTRKREKEKGKKMEETKFLITAVCVTAVFIVSLITDCIKQRSRDRYWRELHEQQSKKDEARGIIQAPEYDCKDLGNGTGWLSQKRK